MPDNMPTSVQREKNHISYLMYDAVMK